MRNGQPYDEGAALRSALLQSMVLSRCTFNVRPRSKEVNSAKVAETLQLSVYVANSNIIMSSLVDVKARLHDG